MSLTRREFATGMALGFGATALGAFPSGSRAAVVGDDGLHVQPWFKQTFLVMKEDLAEATAAGKRFAIIWEQKGCPYCREMHSVNLADKETVDFISGNFHVIQLNMWGSRKVTDFDGKELEERELAQRWQVAFTPTINFFPETYAGTKTGRDIEVMRMPGYFKPFHFISMFEYVKDNAAGKVPFQRYLQDKFKKLEEQGKKPSIW